ncbi:glycosyltransferase family 2 protein [uncultured Thiodictyon sp.]|jgi:glycosyltransferase involved in cell wall biosynthesis|uniref:glycosyltransferase family 2 protein n=1 Tax=uncultured Thiodictyon sp. TaxID=1846217 RepID=UPI0025F83F0A|nr:glycosyltransferase family 2 protein [uncultured Thiodictyon sp.]
MAAFSSSRPAVSICVPTYNGAAYIACCLDSILQQTFVDFEIVAVDDRSSDDTVAILGAYSKRDRRLRIFENSRNLGLVGNWNQCIEHARGEWIKFVFQDDWIAPECVFRMVEDATRTRAVFAVCRREFVFEEISDEFRKRYPKVGEEVSLDRVCPGKSSISAADFCAAVLGRGIDNFIGEPTATLIHRDAIRDYGVFNSMLMQWCDLEYWLRVAVSRGVTYIPETLAYFRVHGRSATFVNASERSFRGDIVDPLLIKCELAYSPFYQPLRDLAMSRGTDLAAEFIRANVFAQSWGKERANPGWRQVVAMEPRLRMAWRFRARSMVRNLLDKMR